MERYAHLKNIERFELKLKSETDAHRRALLEQILADERRRLAELERENGAKAKD